MKLLFPRFKKLPKFYQLNHKSLNQVISLQIGDQYRNINCT